MMGDKFLGQNLHICQKKLSNTWVNYFVLVLSNSQIRKGYLKVFVC